MSWGKSYIEERAEFVVGVAGGKAGCGDIRLGFIEINRIPQICHSGGNLKVLVENIGNTVISQMKARVVDSSGVNEKENVLDQPLPIGESKAVNIPISGSGMQVKITPMIFVEGKKAYCFDKSLEADGPFMAC